MTLVPSSRSVTASGGFTDTPATPRAPQDVKLSLLAFDQRPTITVGGVERIIDYHMIMKHNAVVEVGDTWTDAEGTRYEVVGFTDGLKYEKKAFVLRHLPRAANP